MVEKKHIQYIKLFPALNKIRYSSNKVITAKPTALTQHKDSQEFRDSRDASLVSNSISNNITIQVIRTYRSFNFVKLERARGSSPVKLLALRLLQLQMREKFNVSFL